MAPGIPSTPLPAGSEVGLRSKVYQLLLIADYTS